MPVYSLISAEFGPAGRDIFSPAAAEAGTEAPPAPASPAMAVSVSVHSVVTSPVDFL